MIQCKYCGKEITKGKTFQYQFERMIISDDCPFCSAECMKGMDEDQQSKDFHQDCGGYDEEVDD
jgi:hypothetical protein